MSVIYHSTTVRIQGIGCKQDYRAACPTGVLKPIVYVLWWNKTVRACSSLLPQFQVSNKQPSTWYRISSPTGVSSHLVTPWLARCQTDKSIAVGDFDRALIIEPEGTSHGAVDMIELAILPVTITTASESPFIWNRTVCTKGDRTCRRFKNAFRVFWGDANTWFPQDTSKLYTLAGHQRLETLLRSPEGTPW